MQLTIPTPYQLQVLKDLGLYEDSVVIDPSLLSLLDRELTARGFRGDVKSALTSFLDEYEEDDGCYDLQEIPVIDSLDHDLIQEFITHVTEG